MTLTDAQIDRYARHIVLHEVGGAGQVALLDAHLLVIGAGGIGCPALQSLAAAGVGRITLVDDDRVDLSNLQRQTLFMAEDIGRPKVEAAAQRLAELNPDVALVPVAERVSERNVDALLDGVALVLDGSDNFATRLLVGDACTRARIPLVSASVGRFQGQVAIWTGWQPGEPCYRCFVGDAFDAEDCDGCAEVGVLGAMTAWTANLAALQAIRLITGFGAPQPGLLHLLDGLSPSMRSVRIAKDTACRGCGAISSWPPPSS